MIDNIDPTPAVLALIALLWLAMGAAILRDHTRGQRAGMNRVLDEGSD